MNKSTIKGNSSIKKLSSTLRKTGRRENSSHYEPLFMRKKKRPSSKSPDKKDRKRKKLEEIPNILKKNIAPAASTDFEKSFIEIDDFPSPPKKSFFDNFLTEDTKSVEISSPNIENKLLESLKNKSKHVGLLSSPSIMNTNMSPPSTATKLTIGLDSKVDSTVNETKLKNEELNESKINKVEKFVQQQNEKPNQEKLSKTNENDSKISSDEEKIRKTDNKFDKICLVAENIVKDYRESFNNFKELVNGIKKLNDKVLIYRRQLTDAIKNDFPNSQPDTE